MLVLNSKQIFEINKNGITYFNDENEKNFIDFEECNKNWLEYIQNSDNFTIEEKEKINNTKCVGSRDILERPPCFIFYGEVLTKIEIKINKSFFNFFKFIKKDKEYKEFLKIERKINNMNWTTFDLS